MKLNDSDSQLRLNATLAALADPTRRAIVERLRRGEARVTELAEPFEMSLNAVSKHIRVLEQARLVRRRRVWREHWVAFDPLPLIEAAAWMDKQRAFWSERLDALERILKAEDEAKAGKNKSKQKKPKQNEPRNKR
jgi:DNA-binding transcriptional ArsR family regulator